MAYLGKDTTDALVGTSGVPSTSNKFVTDADTRIPSQDENDALVGTNGTPSSSNKYVTNSDPRLAALGSYKILAGTQFVSNGSSTGNISTSGGSFSTIVSVVLTVHNPAGTDAYATLIATPNTTTATFRTSISTGCTVHYTVIGT